MDKIEEENDKAAAAAKEKEDPVALALMVLWLLENPLHLVC